MRKIAGYFALIGAILLISCEEETLEPRTNPRFSVTIVQEISSSGVQLGADIYDYGDEEILEYGFVYTQSSSAPDLNRDDYVSRLGRPDARFELVANHSMTLGKKYYVSAFLKTANSLVFSKSMEFVSQGSEGFIINFIEWPELIYKDQKLVVKGRLFSKQRDNYKIKLGLFDLYPDPVDSNTFTINLPIGLLTQTTGQNLETELKIEINEKSYTERRVLKFQEPVFENQSIQRINSDEEVVIKGDYLDLGSINLKIGDQQLVGLTASRNELGFFPFKNSSVEPTIAEPEVTFIVRGKSYPLGKVFGLNGPKISENKVILSRQSQVIPAVNVNFNQPSDIKFFNEGGEEIKLDVQEASSSGITVNTLEGIYPGRNFKMQLKSFGVLSNFGEFEIANPVVLTKVKKQPVSFSNEDLALVANENAYVLTGEGIIEVTLGGEFKQRKIADLPSNFGQRFQFIKQIVGDGFVLGGGGSINSQPFYDLYYFSLENLNWERLPDLPAPFTSFTGVTSKNGFLVFEGARKLFDEAISEKWILNRQTKVWERLPVPGDRYLVIQTFYSEGETFLYGFNLTDNKRAIYRMRDDFSWELHIENPSSNSPGFSTPIVFNGKYYILSNFQFSLTEVDLSTKSIRGYAYPLSFYYGRVPALNSRGFYILSGDLIQEDVQLNLFQ
jgi:hypothetical protein